MATCTAYCISLFDLHGQKLIKIFQLVVIGLQLFDMSKILFKMIIHAFYYST